MGNPNFSPDQEYQVALDNYRRGDFPHAIHHLSWALSKDPENTQWLDLLNNILTQSKQPLKLIELKAGIDYANAAVSAYIHARNNDISRALSLFNEIVRVAPQTNYLSWLADWLAVPKYQETADTRVLMNILSAVVSTYPHSRMNARIRKQFERLIPSIKAICVKQQPSGELYRLYRQ